MLAPVLLAEVRRCTRCKHLFRPAKGADGPRAQAKLVEFAHTCLMNDRLSSAPTAATGGPPLTVPADTSVQGSPQNSLPRGLRLGSFEIERVLGRSSSTVVYFATDHALAMPVAIQEYLPARLVRRDAGLHLRAAEPWHDDVIARGRRAFIDEARMLAHCDHPALARVTHLFEALGSVYRVMPVYAGRRLVELRNEMTGAPDEAALRALLYPLLGAIEVIHRGGQAHGGVSPTNILLLADDRPLLLGPGAAGHEIGSDLVDSLMATLEPASGAAAPASAEAGMLPVGAARDLCALAETLRFCITGEALSPPGTLRPREPLADAIAREYPLEARPQYGPALLGTLDAALSPFAEDRPLTAAQFRDWLERGVPGGPIRVAPAPRPASPEPARAPNHQLASDAAADTIFDAREPMAPWPDPLSGLTGDPITPERPPWVPPPLPQLQNASTALARQRKLLIAAGCAVVAGVGLAVTAVWWNTVPDIRLEPTPAVAVAAPAVTAPEQQQQQQQPQQPRPTEPSAAATPLPTTPTAPPAPEVPTSPEAAAPAEPAAPARSIAVKPPAAEPNSSARPMTSASARIAQSGGPRDACAGRTEFALYRCMLQQCQAKRWSSHAQCVKLKRDDRVD